ncbi:hypothetical protein MMC30_008864 [Trapelia coarctata]|nr:hypothetical protein [Trapelia coarctata]
MIVPNPRAYTILPRACPFPSAQYAEKLLDSRPTYNGAGKLESWDYPFPTPPTVNDKYPATVRKNQRISRYTLEPLHICIEGITQPSLRPSHLEDEMTSNSVKRKQVPPPQPPQDAPPPSQQLPQWELPKGYTEEATHKEIGGNGAAVVVTPSNRDPDQNINQGPPAYHRNALSSKLDRIPPSYRTYCGLSRRIVLILLALALLLLLALIIGLAAGLSKRKRYTLPSSSSPIQGPHHHLLLYNSL